MEEAGRIFSLNETNYDNLELGPSALVDGVDEAIRPTSSLGLIAKKFQLRSICGEDAYLTCFRAFLLERLDNAANHLHFCYVSIACATLWSKLLSISDIDEVVQCRKLVLRCSSNDSQGQVALESMIGLGEGSKVASVVL